MEENREKGVEKIEGVDFAQLSGEVELIHRDKDGNIIDKQKIKNLIVNVGKEYVAKLINGVVTDPFTYIQIGTGTTAPVSTNTTLETFYAEGSAACSYEADYKARFAYTFNFTESVTITESGIFDGLQATSPHMLSRRTFTGKAMSATESLEVIWTITVG